MSQMMTVAIGASSNIDPAQLYAVFQATIQPDETIRKQAESHLKELTSTPGFAPSLLQLALMQGVEDASSSAIRQAASVYLKNLVEKHWETYEDTVPSLIAETDKAVLRASIIKAVVAAGSFEAVRVQLLIVVRRLVRSDFPVRWGGVMEEIVPLLQSGDVNGIMAGLSCFLEIVSWRGGKEMKEVGEAIQSHVFPILLELGQRFAGHLEEAAAQQILKIILKCYFTSIQFRFSAWLLGDESTFHAWSSLSLGVVQACVPAAVASLAEEDRAESSYWKMKKWAMHIQNKVMSRYGNSKLDTYAGTDAAFAKAYMANMALPVLQVYLQLSATAGLPERIVCLLCDFFEMCLKSKCTWAVLEGQTQWLLQAFVFPRLCWCPERDGTLWNEDPEEFIRTRLDPFDDVYSAGTGCVNMVVEMVKARKKACFLPTLAFLNGVLQDGNVRPEQKDGALFLVGSLATLLLDSKKVRGQMESFIVSFVLPELHSPQAYLRMRACWVLEQFDEMVWKEPSNAMNALSGVLTCLQGDGAEDVLPVRVAAATALAALLDNEAVAAGVVPYLPRIVETILGLANTIELDSLSYVLEDLVSQFAAEMAPWAAQLCVQLRDTLMRSLDKEPVQDEDGEAGLFDDTDKMMAVLGMLGTLNTLVDSMSGRGETLAQLEAVLLPLMHLILERRLMDVYEELFALLDSLTYGQKCISPALWTLFQPIHAVFLEAGSNYLPDMASSLDNYISYGNAHLLASPQLMAMLLDITKRTLTEKDFVESDWVHACNLVESLLLNCPAGSIDDAVLGGMIQLVLTPLAESQEPGEDEGKPAVYAMSHRVQHIDALLCAIRYNPQAALTQLEAINGSHVLIKRLLELHDRFTRVHDKKILITSISTLLSTCPLSALPPVWQQNWPDLMTRILLPALESLPAAMEARRKLKEEAERDDETTSGERHGRADSDAEESDEEDEEHYQRKEAEGSDFEAYASDDWPSDDDSDWEDADELEEEIYLETPLDQVDAASVAQASLKAAASAQPEAFQQLFNVLPAAQQCLLQTLLQ